MNLRILTNIKVVLMMKFKIYIFITLLTLSFSACKKNSVARVATKILKKQTKENRKDVTVDSLKTYCFYMLDDKYALVSDSLKLDSWLEEKQKAIENNTIEYNLFDKNGGGPYGAEWNPSTNLYLAIVRPVNELNTNIDLSINDIPYSEQVFLKNKNVSWYMVKQDFWEENLQEVNDEKRLEFKIKFNNQIIKKYFYAAYGE